MEEVLVIICCVLLMLRFYSHTHIDAEGRQREERIATLPIPVPRASAAQDPSAVGRMPPVKPRRSIKIRPTTQESRHLDPPATQAGHEVGIIPSEVLSQTFDSHGSMII